MLSHARPIVAIAIFCTLPLAVHSQPTTLRLPVARGPYSPAAEGLARYRCPDWFRDAKLGIWAHWGPQSVPMSGDWYARNMYIQGSPQYDVHVRTYGHPSKFGYTGIIDLWKAEKWDPDRLMALYKKAGARYFVSMACHHDNFDLWNSTHHSYNAVRMGPKRDVVGDWQRAARKQGLRFGVSEHMGASFTWFQVSHGSDRTGPLSGVPYDGARSELAELYHQQALPGDTGWYSNDPRWHQEWYDRVKDLVDQYKPDLLYTDGGVPFGNQVGRSMIAHLYNTGATNGTSTRTVYTCKQQGGGQWVEDLERGVMAGIRPTPWQTDTSIGDWYYNRNWKYRDADWVINMLADIVSKNGNLLINVVQRPDGSLDPEAEKILAEMAGWMGTNGEAIYGTRPWLVHGEGPARVRGGSFAEDSSFSSRDIRFTTRGNTLYAIGLGAPGEPTLAIRSLARFPGATGVVRDVKLLGYAGKIEWSQGADALLVHLPSSMPGRHAFVLKLAVRNIRGFRPDLAVPQVPAIRPSADGSYVLGADLAEMHGDGVKVESRAGGSNIGYWDSASDWVSWKVTAPVAGNYKVTASCATINEGARMVLHCGAQRLAGSPSQTGSWDQFAPVELGTVRLTAGEQRLELRAKDAASWKAINLREVLLVPVAEGNGRL